MTNGVDNQAEDLSPDSQELIRKLQTYKARREHSFALLQATYDIGKKGGIPSVSKFLERCKDVMELRESFHGYQDAILELNVMLDSKHHIPIESSSLAFDELYYEIRTLESTLRGKMDKSNPCQPEIKLPRLQVPIWNGDLAEFANFFALYNQVIHRGPYSAGTKFSYLRASLEGPPLQLIANLSIDDKNYEIAYNRIKSQYASNRTLASYYLNKIFEFKPLLRDSYSDLQSFLTVFDSTYKAYLNVDIPSHDDYFLVHFALRLIPSNLRLLFERQLIDDDQVPSYEELVKFVNAQCRIKALTTKESGATSTTTAHTTPNSKKYVPPHFRTSTPKSTTLLVTPTTDPPSPKSTTTDPVIPTNVSPQNSTAKPCSCCSELHKIYDCSKYQDLSPDAKFELMKKQHRCFRCLGTHPRKSCKSKGRCDKCSSLSHHSSLHHSFVSTSNVNPSPPSGHTSTAIVSAGAPASQAAVKTTTSHTLLTEASKVTNVDHSVLLGTAQALLRDKWGSWSPIRLVIDAGSQINLISSECVKRLGLPLISRPVQLSGAMNTTLGTASGVVDCVLTPRQPSGPQWCTQATVLHKVCADLPTTPVPIEIYERFRHLNLADNTFHMKGKIDFLLGAALYPDILKVNGSVMHGSPAALDTAFGWVIIGNVPTVKPPQIDEPISLCITEQKLHDAVQMFWCVEEVQPVKHVDPSHRIVEEHFVETHQRMPSGRYQVRLPFQPSSIHLPPFGNSRAIAERRWLNVERKLRSNDSLRDAYHAFMQEFLTLGHMTQVTEPGDYIIPHFAILRNSTTSPVRVVFDGSCKDTSGLSLNERLLTGPPLQKDISEVISLFRLNPIAITCDIKMMYRMIEVHPSDRRFQHILWRKSEVEPLKEYALNVVVYGLSPSPFLAQRTLAQLVHDVGTPYPMASRAILESCYMDDVCFSVEDDTQAIQYQNELVQLLKLGGFELRKWASNSTVVMNNVPIEHRSSLFTLHPDQNPTLHILGVVWDPQEDHFSYKISILDRANTKRTILSQVASIYDPLGWLGPVVFWAKSFLQELWAQGFGWDDSLPDSVSSRWAAFASHLPVLEHVKVPRYCVVPHATSIQLIGMCDASSLGFAAVVYLRCCVGDEVKVSLLKAKTKVAPLKTQTIPRLELNAAHLLAKLVKSLEFLCKRLSVSDIFLFSDSQVVLSWLRTPPHLLKTYVANRVVAISEMTALDQWRHVPTHLNAADPASRGLGPSELLSSPLWWRGPDFLLHQQSHWPPPMPELPPSQIRSESRVEMKPAKVSMPTFAKSTNQLLDVIANYSSLTRLRRVFAWILRFVGNSKNTVLARQFGVLRVRELQAALDLCVRVTQVFYFAADLRALAKGQVVSANLRPLTPFLDEGGLLRVGGRLNNAPLPSHSKHPLILPKHAPLSSLICDYYHRVMIHAGPQATQAVLQTRYWILSVRSLLRQRIHKCSVCFKERAKQTHPIMADLPSARVTPARPFTHVGVDMAGPLLAKEHTGRGSRSVKVYVCIFVCMCTKAVHIELVGDLSSAAYLAALERFVARRGLCRKIFCDNGKNFVGAAREHREILSFLRQSETEVADYLSNREIEYCFNPPESPWMGGLWEAAVKSCKTHLRRIVFNRLLTYEELSTFLARIEAVLNSRPLCPLISDSTAPGVLTPGHFLVGSPLVSPAEYNLLGVPGNHLDRWQTIQQASQEFWKIWHSEYLHTLIQRRKWNAPQRELVVGEPVLLYGVQSRPLDWPLGVIERLIPGSDGIARSAEVRTTTGTYIRPVASLIPFPCDQ
uniref:Pol polyprotein n=1 Tax=Lygus hesperus TaxID=30085 RepID=A0A0A9YNG0_LYGHE